MLFKLLYHGVSLLWQPSPHPTITATYCLSYWVKLFNLSPSLLICKMLVFCDVLIRSYLLSKVLRRINGLKCDMPNLWLTHTHKGSIKGSDSSKDKWHLAKWLSKTSDNKQRLCPQNPQGRECVSAIYNTSAFSSGLCGLSRRNKMTKGTSSGKHRNTTHLSCCRCGDEERYCMTGRQWGKILNDLYTLFWSFIPFK